MAKSTRRDGRARRQRRVRSKIIGTAERPRLNVFRSLTQTYAQLIDDSLGRTLAAASTLDSGLRPQAEANKTEQAKVVGRLIAERALARGIRQVVFDRGGYRYHGRVRALAEAARQAGLEF